MSKFAESMNILKLGIDDLNLFLDPCYFIFYNFKIIFFLESTQFNMKIDEMLSIFNDHLADDVNLNFDSLYTLLS